MSNAVSQAFAILNATSETIRNSEVSAREAGRGFSYIIWTVRSSFEPTHGGPFCSSYENRVQLFLNNQDKRSIELIAKQNVPEFKRPKRKKT